MANITTRLLPTAELRDHLLNQVRSEVTALAAAGRPPKLAVVMVGDNPASRIFVGIKKKVADRCGIGFELVHLPADVTAEALLARVDALNEDAAVTGIIVQLPLPAGLDRAAVLARIAAEKDVDGLGPLNTGRGQLEARDALLPATPLGVLRIVDWAGYDVEGRDVVVIGRSHLVGQPMANLLMLRDATVTVCHKQTEDIPHYTRHADMVVVAAGAPGLVRGEMLKPGAFVVDVGINATSESDGGRRVVGDVDVAGCTGVAGTLTPVPGGVGPMTVASLMTNVVDAARLQNGQDKVAWALPSSE